MPTPRSFADAVHDQWIDQALEALDGGVSDSEFVLHRLPEGVGLCCGLCPPDGHSAAHGCKDGAVLFTVGTMELWEFAHDAREHYETHHRRPSPPT